MEPGEAASRLGGVLSHVGLPATLQRCHQCINLTRWQDKLTCIFSRRPQLRATPSKHVAPNLQTSSSDDAGLAVTLASRCRVLQKSGFSSGSEPQLTVCEASWKTS